MVHGRQNRGGAIGVGYLDLVIELIERCLLFPLHPIERFVERGAIDVFQPLPDVAQKRARINRLPVTSR